jgi:hypothetical protein
MSKRRWHHLLPTCLVIKVKPLVVNAITFVAAQFLIILACLY